MWWKSRPTVPLGKAPAARVPLLKVAFPSLPPALHRPPPWLDHPPLCLHVCNLITGSIPRTLHCELRQHLNGTVAYSTCYMHRLSCYILCTLSGETKSLKVFGLSVLSKMNRTRALTFINSHML